MAKDFEFKGIWIPSRVFLDARLTQSDKFLFGVIHILCNERGCFATRETLSDYMSQSVRNTQYSIGRLTDCGYVRKDDDGVLWDIISHTLDRGEKPFMGGVKVSSPKGRKNLHPDSNKDGNKVMDKAEGVDEPVLVSDTFIRKDTKLSGVWDRWLAFRRSRRWPTNNEYIERWDACFASWGSSKAAQAVEQSLLQGWQGIFEPKGGSGIKSQAPKTDMDHQKGF